MALRLIAGLVSAVCALPALAGGTLGDAAALYKQKRWAEALAVLEPLVAAEPSNAAAAYLLGMTFLRAGGPAALDASKPLLEKASRLDPSNEDYLSQYAGVCLLLADRDNSLGLAMEGRDAMTRAIAENPADLESIEGLMQFYAKAPWPLGDADKAVAMAADIAKADPKRGAAAYRSIAAFFDKAGRHDRALAALQEAQRLAPGPVR